MRRFERPVSVFHKRPYIHSRSKKVFFLQFWHLDSIFVQFLSILVDYTKTVLLIGTIQPIERGTDVLEKTHKTQLFCNSHRF